MAGTVQTDIGVDHPTDVVWSTLLRALAVVSDLDATAEHAGSQDLLLRQTAAMDGVAGNDPVPATIDHDARRGIVDLSDLPDVPAGLRADVGVTPDGPTSTISIGVTTDAWWGGAAARVARIGFVRDRVAGQLETRLRSTVREVVDLAVAADEDTLRDLVEHGTPTTRRLASERRERLTER